MTSPRILISGAGIAGLSLARRLDQLGIAHVLIEKRAAAPTGGAGIALPFNAIQALRQLGLAEPVLAAAHQVAEVIYTKKDGAVLGRASLHDAPLDQDKFVAMRRSDLHAILLDGIAPRIHYQSTIESFDARPDGVQVNSANPAVQGHYDLVVSAEGIHSELRQRSFAGETTTVDHNVTNWRFVVDYPQHGLQPTYMFGRSEMFMAYPISPDALYCYAHVYDDANDYATRDAPQSLRQLFGSFGGPVDAILDRLGTQPVLGGRLQSVVKPFYAKGRIVFIGDAGNACSPLLQQGAACAFEDALCLAEQLHSLPVDSAIDAYQKRRAPRVDWIVSASDGPLKMMKTMRSPLGAFMRNMLIRRKGPLNAHGWKQLALR
jgi:2-polyprenyl-6-methoxyphenol hydroxylase-like FAD-dependent oxidoreductase